MEEQNKKEELNYNGMQEEETHYADPYIYYEYPPTTMMYQSPEIIYNPYVNPYDNYEGQTYSLSEMYKQIFHST